MQHDTSVSLDDWFMSEHANQALVFAWAELNAHRWPDLDLLYAVPNGSHKSKAMANRFKREGLRAGVPDICLPVARGGYHALYIEMKDLRPRQTKTRGIRFDRTRTTEQQREWHAKLAAAGNLVVTCYRAEEAQQAIEDYLNLPTRQQLDKAG